VRIREATAADWAGIWPFFQQIVEAGETYAYPPARSSEQAERLWMDQVPGIVVVATDDDGRVLGSARIGPNRPGPGSHVATASFMVDPAASGQGVGRALGRYSVEWARDAGFRGMQFNAVVETNTTAVRLWRSLGFEIIGTVPEAFQRPDGSYVGLHVMYRPL
jgi:L-amino acid N-acyltransferase YncA